MRNIDDMYIFLKDAIDSHEFDIVDNKIIGRKFSRNNKELYDFTITYLKKHKSVVSLSSSRYDTIRHDDEKRLFVYLTGLSDFNHRILKEELKWDNITRQLI